jgi:hypothetical protein
MSQDRCARILAYAALALLLASPRAANAQLLGYVVAGPTVLGGGSESFLSGSLAGGAELLARGRAGVGGEVGFVGTPASGWPVVSAGAVVHLIPVRPGRRQLSPFATAGISGIDAGRGMKSAWNLGGGVDVWRREGIGVRVEYREHFRPEPFGTARYSMLRVGVAFR